MAAIFSNVIQNPKIQILSSSKKHESFSNIKPSCSSMLMKVSEIRDNWDHSSSDEKEILIAKGISQFQAFQVMNKNHAGKLMYKNQSLIFITLPGKIHDAMANSVINQVYENLNLIG